MTYSQFGEDDFVAERLRRDHGTVVEVGAGDGHHLSNSALFRSRGWWTVLVEPAEEHRGALRALEDQPNVVVHYEAATPDNVNDLVPSYADFVSIDVDGDDYFLLEALEHRPEFLCVEYNPTMPQHVDIHPARLGTRVGTSIRALKRVASTRGYGLVRTTVCNVIFQRGVPDDLVLDIVPVPDFYVATDYFTGRPFVVGTAPWGVDFANPLPPEDVVVR